MRKAASPPQKIAEPSPQREKNSAADQERLMLETQMTFFVEEIEKVVQRDNTDVQSSGRINQGFPGVNGTASSSRDSSSHCNEIKILV